MKEKETTKEDTGLKTGYVLNRRDVKNVLGERTETREKTDKGAEITGEREWTGYQS